jgi:hypothetical protein
VVHLELTPEAGAAVASLKWEARAAIIAPLIAPAEAPQMIRNGDGPSASPGISPMRFSTPA